VRVVSEVFVLGENHETGQNRRGVLLPHLQIPTLAPLGNGGVSNFSNGVISGGKIVLRENRKTGQNRKGVLPQHLHAPACPNLHSFVLEAQGDILGQI
jgi:hypothetical protein